MRRLITAILVAAVCLSGCKDSNVKNMSIAEISTEETIEIKKETTEEIKIETEKVIEEPETEESSASDSTEVTVAETMLEKKNEEQQWKQAYIKYITEEWDKTADMPMAAIDYFGLIFINEDNMPELYCHNAVSGGGTLHYYNGEELKSVDLIGWGTNPLYIERGNQFYASGGKMDVYDDIIYSIRDNHIIELHHGDFGFVGGDGIPINENGEPYYRYFWDGVEVASREEYEQKITTCFDESKAHNALNNSYSPDEIIEAINSF